MKVIVVLCANSGSVVFHSAPCSREYVDNLASVVQADIEMQQTIAKQGVRAQDSLSVGASSPNPAAATADQESKNLSFRTRRRPHHSYMQRGGLLLGPAKPYVKSQRRAKEGVVAVYASDHPWMVTAQPPLPESTPSPSVPSSPWTVTKSLTDLDAQAASDDSSGAAGLILWRIMGEFVLVFSLDATESIALAQHAMSLFIILLADVFKCGAEPPSVKDLAERPEKLQEVCSIVAPSNFLAVVDVHVARQAMKVVES